MTHKQERMIHLTSRYGVLRECAQAHRFDIANKESKRDTGAVRVLRRKEREGVAAELEEDSYGQFGFGRKAWFYPTGETELCQMH
ncbi:hypothetical protein HPP92_021290 [Vanilla planifolia]|uniref:Uncharacterized protein n=1 Tax=Vanilla planifolia TaxID=51239 RepID=A0A835PZK4_VANPL|nr:hypothetical protein HPP92_021290 [Vanilla planifolia]